MSFTAADDAELKQFTERFLGELRVAVDEVVQRWPEFKLNEDNEVVSPVLPDGWRLGRFQTPGYYVYSVRDPIIEIQAKQLLEKLRAGVVP